MSNQRQASKQAVKRKKYKRPGLAAWILSLAALGACVFFILVLFKIDILPGMYLMVGSLIILLFTVLMIMIWLFKTRKPFSKLLSGIIVCVLGCGFVLGSGILISTEDMFNAVTNLTDKVADSVTVYAMTESEIKKPADLSGKTVGISTSLDSEGTYGVLSQLKKNASFETIEYNDPYSMVDDLYSGQVDAIAFPEGYHDAINEIADDNNKYNALTTFTNVVDRYTYYTERSEALKNTPDSVNNIMTDAFTVLISGNDSYGSLNSTARSDVNMLVCVNPKTAKILLVSLPRDAYVDINTSKSPGVCEAYAGWSDKLSHIGLCGVSALESSVEEMLGVEINYTVRLNFSSLINIVDAIGGIDVEVEPGLEVERFYANGTEGVHAGTNHLNGERALAFARERHAYVDGDLQRNKNQQIVMKSIIKAMMSPAMIMKYPDVMEALSTAFETNMSAQEIKSLLTLEITRFPRWDIQSCSITGDTTFAYSPFNGAEASVMDVSASSIDEARTMIQSVLQGQDHFKSADGSQRTGEDTAEPYTMEDSIQYEDTAPYEEYYPIYNEDNAEEENDPHSSGDYNPVESYDSNENYDYGFEY